MNSKKQVVLLVLSSLALFSFYTNCSSNGFQSLSSSSNFANAPYIPPSGSNVPPVDYVLPSNPSYLQSQNQENVIYITNSSNQDVSQYPVQIGRAFLPGEIKAFPSAILNDVTALNTQVDVKNRYPDNSVKFAVISFVIPQLKSKQKNTIKFSNVATANNTGLTRDQMLSGDFNFEATMQISGAMPSQTLSARQMILDQNLKYWTQGPIATSIILADHTSARKYDMSVGGYKPIRPLIYATFWPGLNRVKVRFVAEVSHSEELMDVTYNLQLSTGLTSPQVVYSKNSLVHYFGSRWTKTFWINNREVENDQVNIDHNLNYLKQTKFVPNYDSTVKVEDATIQKFITDFSTYSADLYERGPWAQYMGMAGGRADIGPYPNWNIYWLYTGDWRVRDFALTSTDLAAAWPMHIREGRSDRRFLRSEAPRSGAGLGHTVSLTDHKTTSFGSGYDYAYTLDDDKVKIVGPNNSVANPWQPDGAHQPAPFFIPYLFTADPFYLEEMYLWAGWSAHLYNGAAFSLNYGRGPTGAEGGIQDQVRGNGWVLRNRAEAAFMAPDGDLEKEYFTTLVHDAIALWAGRRGIQDADHANDPTWIWSNKYFAQGYTGEKVSPLHFFENNDSASTVQGLENANLIFPNQAKTFTSPWMQHFMGYGLARAGELGFKVSGMFEFDAKWRIEMVTDPSSHPLITAIYQVPTSRITGQFSSWADFRSIFVPATLDARIQEIQNNISTGNIDYDHGYILTAMAALSYSVQQPKGAEAWAWMYNNVYSKSDFKQNPKWAIVPR